MSNIIRIRNLTGETFLNDVIIPVDKSGLPDHPSTAYGSICKNITISRLKTWILSAYTADETYTSDIKASPYWTVGGIIAGVSFPSGFTNVSVKYILDLMLYPTTTTTTTLAPTTTTTTTCSCSTPTLDSITLSSGSLFNYIFSGVLGCVAMTLQYSRSISGPWIDNTGSCVSPGAADTGDATGTWYFRLIKICGVCNSIPSNTLSYSYTTTTTTTTPTPTTTTTTTEPTTTTTTTPTPPLDHVYIAYNVSGFSGGRLTIEDVNNTEILYVDTDGSVISGSITLLNSLLPYTVYFHWISGSGNIVRGRICDTLTGSEIYYSGDVTVGNTDIHTVNPTPINVLINFTSGSGNTPSACLVPPPI